ncbi:hypothetical protein [Pontibacter pamirensis]|uniref:hypothetical protein n=1 Tax=Pontibacter pamirensis TaxID=2562824 RepID=UPI00138A6368|nr:hypothetical protein [Pontibacter pamirensis]
MEELSKIVKLVTNSISLNLVLPIANGRLSKEDALYEGIKNGKYITDEAAAKDLYRSKPNDVRYKMLKHRLKKKLYNNLLFLDYNKFGSNNDFIKEQACLLMLQQAYTLRLNYEFDLVLQLVGKVMAIAQEYEYTNHQVTALELAVACYSEKGNLKQFDKTLPLLEEALLKRNLESKAINIFQSVNVNLKKSVTARKRLLPRLPEMIDTLNALWQEARTFASFDAYYKTSISYYELIGSFEKIVEMTVNAETWVEKGVINSLRFKSNYNKFVLVYAHLRNKDYANGLQYAEKYALDFKEGYINWFPYMENYFLLALHSNQLELSGILLNKVLSNSSFQKISNAAKERWSLYQMYYRLFSLNSTIPNNVYINPYSLSLPEYSKDKLGFNVAILILQFIYFLQKGDSEALLYRIESLKKYILTHLKDAFSLRSKTFLKLLILTVTEDFEADECKKKGQKLYQKLIETPPPGDAYAEIEIVPYEHLWKHILSILENKS